MTTYDDYFNFINENQDLLDRINNNVPILSFYIKDILGVLNLIYQKHIKNERITMDEDDLFDIGFAYMTNFISDINYMIENHFNNNEALLLKYQDIIFYYFEFEDLEEFLDAENYLDEDRTNLLDDVNEKIQAILSSGVAPSESDLDYLNSAYTSLTPVNNEYTPLYVVFTEAIQIINENDASED